MGLQGGGVALGPSISLQLIGMVSVLLRTVLLFTLTIFFLESLKTKEWCFFPPVLGLHFLIIKIFDGLLMNVFHSE